MVYGYSVYELLDVHCFSFGILPTGKYGLEHSSSGMVLCDFKGCTIYGCTFVSVILRIFQSELNKVYFNFFQVEIIILSTNDIYSIIL